MFSEKFDGGRGPNDPQTEEDSVRVFGQTPPPKGSSQAASWTRLALENGQKIKSRRVGIVHPKKP